jgi:diguanylate cyclase (GGDEF)-like protein
VGETTLSAVGRRAWKRFNAHLIGSALLALGLAGLSGWWGYLAGWSSLKPALLPMVLCALLFLLAGAALLLPESRPILRSRGQLGLGLALMALAGFGLAQDLSGLPFNVHKLVASTQGIGPGLHPAGIAPNAALAFILGGLTLVLAPRVRARWVGGWVQLMLIGLVFLGLMDLAGNALGFDAIYPWYKFIKMTPWSAAGVALFGVELWRQVYRLPWHQQFYLGQEDRKITLVSGIILLLTAWTAGLAAFGTMAVTTEEVLKNSLQISLENRRRIFEQVIQHALEKVEHNSTRPRLVALMYKLSYTSVSSAEHREFDKIFDNIRQATGVTAFVLYDAHGRRVGGRGKLVANSEIQAPLATPDSPHRMTLLWDQGTVLHARVIMKEGETPVATLVTDIPVPEIDKLAEDVTGLGQTGTMAVCAPLGEKMQCFPNRLNNYKVVKPPRHVQGQPLPMSLALEGQSGMIRALDAQAQDVIAAYGPIGRLGLGMVVRARTAELYLPIRGQFRYLLLMILVLALIGLLLLRWQLTPLARKLVHEIHERKSAENRLSYLAHHDALTGLPNRVLFTDRLEQAMIEATRHRRMVAVMFIDLDDFKFVNDTLGHEAGDALLKNVALRLQNCVRRGDTVSRLSGDEFSLILSDIAHPDDVGRVAEKILESFLQPHRIAERDHFITTSIGVSLYPNDGQAVEALLKNADIAMYRAKERGKNTFQYYSSEMADAAHERLSLINALRYARERRELLLHYQPQVDLKTGRILGMEALARWNNVVLGMVPPAKFIPVAEEAGLIVPIGEWVLKSACAQAQAWRAHGYALRVAVNFSAHQFRQKNLVDMIVGVLNETGLAPKYLDVELTESVLMQSDETHLANLQRLEELGVKIAVDDFGTGYSSLSYLKRFPIDILKIGGSFVQDITTDPDDAAITRAIITMGHSLNLQVIAEGVETREQLAFLRENGCDAIQGYYFSRPVPAEELTRMLREQRHLEF